MSGRGKKLNQVKNERAHAEWMEGKKLGRTKQQWIWDTEEISDTVVLVSRRLGHWEKI